MVDEGVLILKSVHFVTQQFRFRKFALAGQRSHPSLPLSPLAMGLSALPLIPLGSMIDRNAIAVAIVLSVLSVVFLSIALLM
jgi:hypothetical protein